MTDEVRVEVISRNCARWVDTLGNCECGSRRIERGEGAVGRPEEAMTDEACVSIGSRDGPPLR